jgi:hypothetical protein
LIKNSVDYSSITKDIKKLIAEKDSYVDFIQEFMYQYQAQLNILLQRILYHEYEYYKKEYSSIFHYYETLKKSFEKKRKVFIELTREKTKCINNLSKASISSYEELFKELISIQKKLEYRKDELLDIKQLLKNIDLHKYKTEFERYNKEYLEFKEKNKSSNNTKNIKEIYKKASKICHPDLVDKSREEEAKKLFQNLNDAYKSNDFETIQSLYTFLQSNKVLFARSGEQSLADLKIYKKNILMEIKDLKFNHEYSELLTFTDKEKYFQHKKKELEKKLELVLEPKEKDENYTLATLYKWAIFHKLDYKIFPISAKKLKTLTVLTLSAQRIMYLPDDISFLQNLEKLIVSNNTIAKLPDGLGKLKKLAYLDLSNNKIDRLPLGIKNLKKLHYLNLQSNMLKKVPSNIGLLESLKVLNLSQNNITAFSKELYKLTSLEEIYFNENNLRLLPKDIHQLKNLKVVEFAGNKIRSVSKDFYNLGNLRKISLWGNELRFMPQNISQLLYLEELNLGSNYLQSLPSDIMELKVLNNLNITMNHSLSLTKTQEQWYQEINGYIF